MDYVKRLEKLMTRLRAPRGCPWDRRQTHQSLKPYLLEETHEVLDAINEGKPEHLMEELGDLLLQVLFHSQIAKEKGKFNFRQVAKTIGDKLVRRHPHVFGKGASRKIADINRKWEELKRLEKPERLSVLDGLPKSLPALLRVQRMLEKTSKAEKPPARSTTPLKKTLAALQSSLARQNRKDQEKALGDHLLHLAQWAQSQGLHAETALQAAAARFEKDFRKSEARHPASKKSAI
ncbi:MAG: nucleoside triphosphate pyrophosphohydrolase [bacterium]